MGRQRSERVAEISHSRRANDERAVTLDLHGEPATAQINIANYHKKQAIGSSQSS